MAFLASCSRTYNVYFWFQDEQKEYLIGKVQGLDACQATAFNFAREKNIIGNASWSYICCLEVGGNTCAVKER
jgi:hypothetical protein